MQNPTLTNQKTVKPTNFQTKKNFKPTNFQTNKLLNQQTFKPTNFQTNNILRQKTSTSILVSWHTFNLIDFQTDKHSIWHTFWADIFADWHFKLIDVQMDIRAPGKTDFWRTSSAGWKKCWEPHKGLVKKKWELGCSFVNLLIVFVVLFEQHA